MLRLVAAGLSNRQIAETLSISERTVKFHVTAIFNKLGADNRAQAVALAAERGLLSHSELAIAVFTPLSESDRFSSCPDARSDERVERLRSPE